MAEAVYQCPGAGATHWGERINSVILSKAKNLAFFDFLALIIEERFFASLRMTALVFAHPGKAAGHGIAVKLRTPITPREQSNREKTFRQPAHPLVRRKSQPYQNVA